VIETGRPPYSCIGLRLCFPYLN